ncbi:MAG: glycosyltransferase [Gammaproteobacteria bacterium]
MRRVLHLRSSAGFYGAERVLVTLLKRLPALGIDPVLACIQDYRDGNTDLMQAAAAAGIAVIELPCRARLNPGVLRHLLSATRENRVDCIHTHDYKSHLYGMLAARLSGVPIVATLHGWTSERGVLRLYQHIEAILLRGYACVITVEPSMAERLRKLGLPTEIVRTIENGVDTEVFSPLAPRLGRARWGLTPDHFVFGTIGRLSPEKGQRYAIEAFSMAAKDHPRARLVLIGDGPDRAGLQQLSASLGVAEKIILAGVETAVERSIPDLDCYVSPSLSEGMPMILLEAMASGALIIATAVGGIEKMLEGGVGVLVPAGDSRSLADTMERALRAEFPRWAIGERARTRCLARYSAMRQAQRYAGLYRDVEYANRVERTAVGA